MRALAAACIGLLVGVAVAAAVNSVPWWDPFRFWGLFFGAFTAVVTFGLALMFLGRAKPRGARGHSGPRRIGRVVAGVTLAIFGLLTLSWIWSWGVTPLTLEGAWIYPLALIPLAIAVLLLKPARPRKERAWDPPRPRASNASNSAEG